MLKRALMLSLFALILCGSLITAQYDRDEVLQITYPTTGTVINADSMIVTFDIASYFTLGDSACIDCDGYLAATLNGLPVGQIYVDGPFIVRDLTDGYYLFMLEAVDPNGNSFLPAVWDTVSMSVMYEEGFCPPTDLTVSSVAQYDDLVLNWRSPAGTSVFEDFNESFDEGLPADWEIIDGGTSADTWFWITDDAGSTLDGTPFMFVDSDAAGIGVALDEELITPSIASAGAASLNLIFDHYYNNSVGDETGDVDVWDGSEWVTVATFEDIDYGTWTLPDHQVIDISSYANNDLKVRFHYYNADWDFYWAIDNVMLTAEVPEATWMYVYDLTPEGWAAQQMTKEEFHNAYPDRMTAEEMIDMSTLERIDIPLREDILSCGNLVSYDIYRDATPIANIDTTYYVDSDVTLGTEYCYYIEAVYDSSNTGNMVNSDSSNNACGIPETFIPVPPTYLTAIPGDEEVYLNWEAPGLIIPEGENCLNPYIITDNIADGTNLVLNGTTTGFANDFMNGFSAGSPDVVYQFSVIETVDISFSLCTATWDTYLMLLSGDCLDILAFDDDGCATGLQSLLEGTLEPGIYGIVVDGYGTTNSGDYALEITATASTRSVGFTANVTSAKEADLEALKAFSDREIANSSVVVNSEYLPNSTMDIEFGVNYSSSDAEYLDGLSLTFPADFVVNYATDVGGLVYNGETGAGATVTFGDFADDGFGELSSDAIFFVNVTIGDISGTQTLNWGLSGDTFGSDPHDITGTLDIDEYIPADGDFLGYNIYVDAAATPDNSYPLMIPGYMVEELTNAVTYDFQVTALYHPDYESAPLSVSATPTWLFGDITGVITDPNGVTLDSAVVSAAGISDTTGTDGVYLLHNLIPGTYPVNVKRPGFDSSKDDVIVIAQEAASVQDFMLIPKLGKPGGLIASGDDMAIDLAWNSPGAMLTGDWMFFHDGTFENAFSATSGGMGLAQLFVPASYPATIQAVRFHTSDFGSPTQNEGVWVFADDGVTVLSGPYVLPGVSNDWIEIDIDDATIESGGFLVATYNILPGGPYVSVDDSYYDGSLFFGNAADGWDELGSLGYFYVGSHEALIAAAGGRSVTTAGDVANSAKTILRNEQLVGQWTAAGVHGESALRLPNVLRTTSTRIDSLIGYHIYQELTDGDSLVGVNAGNDTTATIAVPANYVEYCFTVKAVWDTDMYDTLESKPSNMACIVPYLPGDVDFIGGVDILDLLLLVDFALGIIAPSPDQLRGGDLNLDGTINIQDIIMIVDIILPPTAARVSNSDDGTSAVLGLSYDGQNNLRTLLTYDGIVRGAQFSIKYDANVIELGTPGIPGAQKDLIINYRESQPGIMNVVIANVAGGALNITDETLLLIPLTVKENSRVPAQIILEQSILVGSQGQSIPVIEKSISLDILSVPTRYALHQNYPNPFNPVTDILFDLPEAGPVELIIYNLMGQVVRTLVNIELPSGYHEIRWNGLSDKGAPVATGMYFYQINAGSYHATKKMLLLK